MSAIETLRQRYPWPDECPDVELNPDGWFCGENRKVLQRLVPKADVVLELGAWLGMSTRFLVDHTPGTVITIDHWKGSREHQKMALLPILYETFVRNAWDHHRERLIPMKTTIAEGLREVAELGIQPNVIYFDGGHGFDEVEENLIMICDLFPKAHIVGDDWTWKSVRQGVGNFLVSLAKKRPNDPTNRHFIGRFSCYEFLPEGVNAHA